MGAHSITLHLPDPLYAHFKNQAKRARRSLEAELLRIVATAAPAEEACAPAAEDHEASSSRALSLEEAAAILNVSQPYVVTLLDEGKLSYRDVDNQRRVDLEELLAYKQHDLAHRRRLLAELTAEAQELGLDY